jgi:protein SCO1/2
MFRYPIPWLVTLLLASASCSSSDDQPRTGPSREPSSGSSVGIRDRDYPLVGIVEELDRESGRVVIRHEAIPGFMPAMAMPFDLKGQEVLDDLQVGDKVEGRLIVSAESSRLTDVVITALADPKAVVSGRAGEGTGGRPPLMPGGAVPDFAMTTQTGETLRLSELRGKVVVLTFIYTRCPLPEFCPLMDRKFGELTSRRRFGSSRSASTRSMTPPRCSAVTRGESAPPPRSGRSRWPAMKNSAMSPRLWA